MKLVLTAEEATECLLAVINKRFETTFNTVTFDASYNAVHKVAFENIEPEVVAPTTTNGEVS